MAPRAAASLRAERTVLANGLRLLVAPDRSSPLVAVAVVFDVGFRSEPVDRSGFAHLFEHLMFQGSAHVAKMEHARLVQSAGGVMNGYTRADLTAYFESLPTGGLELALWLEADRMGAVRLDQENLDNQVAVVEEEIRVNVLNRPYGGFPWISLPMVAFDTYPNAHNGYGDFAHLEEATLGDAADFFRRYYAPSNAVLAVAGDCRPEQVLELVERHFGPLPARRPPARRRFGEARVGSERRVVLEDPLAPTPAFAVGYRVPDPVSRLDDVLAFVVLASVLADGDASRLRSRLLHRDATATDIGCYIGTFGDVLAMRDPVLLQVLVFHPGIVDTDGLLAVVDEELSRVANEGPSPEELSRVAATYAASHWREQDQLLGRAQSFAIMELIHGNADLAGDLPALLAAVGKGAVAAAAASLLEQNRVVLEVKPARSGSSGRSGGGRRRAARRS